MKHRRIIINPARPVNVRSRRPASSYVDGGLFVDVWILTSTSLTRTSTDVDVGLHVDVPSARRQRPDSHVWSVRAGEAACYNCLGVCCVPALQLLAITACAAAACLLCSCSCLRAAAAACYDCLHCCSTSARRRFLLQTACHTSGGTAGPRSKTTCLGGQLVRGDTWSSHTVYCTRWRARLYVSVRQ